MRYICLFAVLLALPLTASAQEARSGDRRSSQHRSEERRAVERKADDGQREHRRTDAKPPSTSPLPWWERQQAPWWERQQLPTWEINRIPGYAQGNVARAMLDQQRNLPQRNQQQTEHRRWPRHYPPSVVYVLPPYRYVSESLFTTTQFAVAPAVPPAPAIEPVVPLDGALRIEVEPRESLQIFVDGVFLGTPEDLGDELELRAGTHRIELRARDHRPLAFDVEIVGGRSITYRGALDPEPITRPPAPRPVAPAQAARPAPAAPAGSTKIYVIPGCYMGNVSPTNVTLPAGCDITKVTTFSQ